ncbi:MAG: dTDP-4-dehydrorhamnose reductase [Anaerolineaceae bacterium]|nr:dTDP-4-dehydrorhamnose reductase [Anaerolineaceae bacterium]
MIQKKILLLGSNGQLGWEAHRHLIGFSDVVAVDYPDIDFSEPEQVLTTIKAVKPDLIFNAVAYTAVDLAEDKKDLAYKINAYTPGEIGTYCKTANIPLIHFSTDYVFDGKKGSDYTELDEPNPLNIYGKSKLLGEELIRESECLFWTIRTSWVYSNREGGFLKKALHWAKTNEELKIVDDQIGNPTWCRALANAVSIVLAQNSQTWDQLFFDTQGLYHLAGWGSASRFDWTQQIMNVSRKKHDLMVKNIIPVKTNEFPAPAERPTHSALNCEKFEKTFNLKLPDWRDAVRLVMEEI